MRRTTICRSEGSRFAVAIALLVVAGPLVAQQPAPQQRPVEQARRAAQQAQPAQQAPVAQPAPQTPAGQGQGWATIPPTHTVQQGETLWSLAQQFLGDPLLWPEIYRLNTDVVEDPHWIFPGEELRFVPGEQPSGGNLAVTPGVDSTRGAVPVGRAVEPAPGPTIFAQGGAPPQQVQVQMEEERAYRAVREGEYYASGFVADSRLLPSGTLVGNTERSAIRRLSSRLTAAILTDVVVAPPAGETFRRGDMLLTFTVDRTIPGYGEVIVPTGLLRVTSDGEPGGSAPARVIGVYGPVNSGQRLIKVPAFTFAAAGRPQPMDSGVVGEVIGTRRGGELSTVQDVLFVSRGADDGVRLGDIFRISSAPDPARGGLVREQAEVVVVNTRPTTATCIVVQVSQPDIRPGAAARQVRRMPS
jgi:hypothetical protein